MKKTLFSRIIGTVAAFTLALSLLPGTSITADAAKQETIDWCLNADGTIRDGVEITGHYTKNDGTATVLDKDTKAKSIGTDRTLSTILTATEKEWYDWGQSWGSGWYTDAKSGDIYYILVDLGAERAINEIGYVPVNNPNPDVNTYWRNTQIFLSNDKDFSTSFEVTPGATVYKYKEMATFTYSAEETKTYRYIKLSFPASGVMGAAKLTVKGIQITEAEDLLHDSEGNLTAALSSCHAGYAGIAGVNDINSIADGKYEIKRFDNGALNLDETTSFVTGWHGCEEPWVQADLGEAKAIEKVRVLLYPGTQSTDSYFRRGKKVVASNDPSFKNYITLAEVNSSTTLEEGEWLEYYDEDSSGKYRYIRVLGSDKALGVTELEVYGYALCESFLAYTNIDTCLITDINTNPKRVSNVSNLETNKFRSWDTFSNNLVGAAVNDRLQLVFSGNVDASTVTKDSITIKNTYKTGNGSATSTKTVDCTFEVKGDTIYIDLYNFESFADVELNITSAIKVNGMNVEPQTLKFKTQQIAPVPYVEGKVIKNVALNKTVMSEGTADAELEHREGNCYLTDNDYTRACGSFGSASHDKYTIDLGKEYDIAAYGISTNSAAWHIDRYSVYMSESDDELMSKTDKVHTGSDSIYSNRMCANKKLDTAKKARYITLDKEVSTAWLKVTEFLAYAYMPADEIDAYYDYNGTKWTFSAEIPAGTTAKVIVARYNADGSLADVTATDENSLAFDSSVTNEDGTTTNYTVKSFVLSDIGTLKPLTSAVIY